MKKHALSIASNMYVKTDAFGMKKYALSLQETDALIASSMRMKMDVLGMGGHVLTLQNMDILIVSNMRMKMDVLGMKERALGLPKMDILIVSNMHAKTDVLNEKNSFVVRVFLFPTHSILFIFDHAVEQFNKVDIVPLLPIRI